jgi:hypothetical protein
MENSSGNKCQLRKSDLQSWFANHPRHLQLGKIFAFLRGGITSALKRTTDRDYWQFDNEKSRQLSS